MFTLSLLYVVFYLFIFLSFLILSFSQLPVYFLTHLSTPKFLIFIQKYKVTKNLYFWLFFSLTGLPPVGLFFVKFNMFFFILYQSHVFVIILLFFFFFLNMLYYMQMFNFKNYKHELYTSLTPSTIQQWNTNARSKSYLTSYNHYYLTLTVVNTVLFLVLTVVFFADYYLVLNLL